MSIHAALNNCPIIAAVKDEKTLADSLNSEANIVFVLYGTINTIIDIVSAIKTQGKYCFVHMDLIEGLSSREASVDYLINNTQLDGIISTKLSILRYAKSKGMRTIMRFFVIDSLAMKNVGKIKNDKNIDLIEILPGLMPKIIKSVVSQTGKRVIASGLINDKVDIVNALDAGAVAVSSTNPLVWNM